MFFDSPKDVLCCLVEIGTVLQEEQKIDEQRTTEENPNECCPIEQK